MASGSHIPSGTYKNNWIESSSGNPGNGQTYENDKIQLGYVSDEDIYDKDVNNYNFAKLEETLSNIASQAWLKNQLLNLIYPVGSIYMSTNNASPETFLGGTWIPIEKRFLFAAEEEGQYTAGSAGGNYDAIIPTHTHPIHFTQNLIHSHPISGRNNLLTGNDNVYRNEVKVDNTSKHYVYMSKQSSSADTSGLGKASTPTTTESATLAITINKNTDQAGEEATNKNMPPYLCVYMWQRVEDPT